MPSITKATNVTVSANISLAASDTRIRPMDDGSVVVTVDLGTVRAALTSIVPGGFTNIREVGILDESTLAVFSMRIVMPQEDADVDDTLVQPGDTFSGLINDIQISNASLPGESVTLILFRRS